MVVSDFASEYQIRLLRDPLTWREFKTYLVGLLSCDSRLFRFFNAPGDDDDEKE